MVGVLELCENYLMTLQPTVQNLCIADNCGLEKLLNYCRTNIPKNYSLDELVKDDYYMQLPLKMKLDLMKTRLAFFEKKWKMANIYCKCGVSCRGNGHSAADFLGALGK